MNRGKKSTVINLKHPQGLRAFNDLVRHSDVIIDNFRPGVLKKLKADYSALCEFNPRIVCCSITGFGNRGPDRDMPSFDLIHQAMSGHLSITGEPAGRPVRVGIPLADLSAALFAVIGILAALAERATTGRGQHIDLSMLHVMTFLLGYDATIFLNTGEIQHALGTAHSYHVPWQAFQTTDGWIVVATREEAFWRNFCQAIGRSDLVEDERFRTNLRRVENRKQLLPILEARIRERSSAEWLAVFRLAEVPSGPVNDIAQALTQPQLVENGGVVEVPYGPTGNLRMLADPIRMSGHTHSYGPPPRLGEHTRQILTRVAGYTEAQITDLERQRAISAWEG
jgi:crotonobetainyl-CoA:carnitine CoA-transferase CaiB-like acyl-CoA transferase